MIDRYYFDVHGSDFIDVDDEGSVCRDLACARAIARGIARDVMAGRILHGDLPLDWHVIVRDGQGHDCIVLRFADALGNDEA